MPLSAIAFILLILAMLVTESTAFVARGPVAVSRILSTTTTTRGYPRDIVPSSRSLLLFATPESTTTTFKDLTEPEQRVYSLVEALHKSEFTFRIVVVGQGAILETTSMLGPILKLQTSPKTGNPLLTLASIDQSFEFHLHLAEVSKVALTEKTTGHWLCFPREIRMPQPGQRSTSNMPTFFRPTLR